MTRNSTLAATRLLWAIVTLSQLPLLGITALLHHSRTLQPVKIGQGPALLLPAFAAVPICIALGYFLRAQTYKRHWQGNDITPAGYFAGNRSLFMLLGASSCLGLAAVAAGAPWWPGAVPTSIAMLALAVNYPHGKPMAPTP